MSEEQAREERIARVAIAESIQSTVIALSITMCIIATLAALVIGGRQCGEDATKRFTECVQKHPPLECQAAQRSGQ